MSSNSLLAIASLLFPEVLIDTFEIIKHDQKDEKLHFYLTEDNSRPEEFENEKLSSKVFFAEALFRIFLEEEKLFTCI